VDRDEAADSYGVTVFWMWHRAHDGSFEAGARYVLVRIVPAENFDETTVLTLGARLERRTTRPPAFPDGERSDALAELGYNTLFQTSRAK